MKRPFRIALAALMLFSVIVGAGATPAAASCTDVSCDDSSHVHVDNDGIDIDNSENVVIDTSEDNDFLDNDLDLL